MAYAFATETNRGRAPGRTDPGDREFLSRLNAVRLIIVGLVATGYASTMSVGPGSREWLNSFGYDPSFFGLQVLFFLSGWLAWRSLQRGASIADMLLSRARRSLPWVFLYTLIVTAVLYPVLCNHDAPHMQGTADLALYFIKTVTLVQPGEPLPGALDNALYACLLQGTIWSLRLGAVAFIALAMVWLVRLRRPFMLLVITAFLTWAHVVITAWTTNTGADVFGQLTAALWLGHPFMFGVTVRAYADRLPKTGLGWGTMFAALMGATLIHWFFLPWTYAIQVMAMASWCGLAMTLLHSRSALLRDWPDLVLPSYLGIWPITQTLLYVFPDITVPELVALSLAVTLGVALVFRALFDLFVRPVHRGVQTA